MKSVSSRLNAAGMELPVVPAPAGAYVPAVRSGNLVFTAGQLPLVDGSLVSVGTVGSTVDESTAFVCARVCALNALAAAATVCSLDQVARVVKLTGYVSSVPGFTAQPTVVNGASEVLAVAFGEKGAHAREAVGVAALPLDAPVEVSVVLEVV